MIKPSILKSKTVIAAGFLAGVYVFGFFAFAAPAGAAEYYKQGALVSVNLSDGLTYVGAITQFSATMSLPSGTSATIQFSRNKLVWYDRLNEAHASTTLADGVNNLNVTALGWSGPVLYYKLNFYTNNIANTPSVTSVTVTYDQSAGPTYAYYMEGTLVSVNMLNGLSDVGDITGFSVTANIPSGAAVTAQFSRDKLVWYDHLGTAHASTTLADGANNIDLTGLGWSGPLIYYKLHYTTSDVGATGTVTFAQITYSAGDGKIYFKQGALVSTDLVAAATEVSIDRFGYNLASLPVGTAAYVQFATSTDGYWWSASGALWATTTLAVGDHLSEASAIDLTALNWSSKNFYYKIIFTTNDNGRTPALSDILLYYTQVRPIYRSVGPSNTTALATGGSNAMTISGGTATFATGLPANIGVGDVIQYAQAGGATPDSLAFIAGRASPTSYTVKDVAGRTATSTSANTGWSLFRAYTSLANAESGIENTGINSGLRNFDDWTAGGDASTDDVGKNLASSTEQWNIAAYADAADTTGVTVGGWTTATSTYIRIYTPYLTTEVGTSQRHSGKWDEGKFNLVHTGSGSAIDIGEEYVRVDGLQLKKISTGAQWPIGIHITINNINSDIHVSNNIITADLTGLTNYGRAIINYYNSSSIGRVWNNIIYNFNDGSGGTDIAIYCESGSGVAKVYYIYNNTLYDNERGIEQDGDAVCIVKNNISYNNTNNYVGTFTSSSNNLSGPTQTGAPGSNPKNGVTVQFVDAANKNFHLKSSDNAAIDNGVNLSADANLAFTDDIDGELRRGKWAIGADQQNQRATKINMPQTGRYTDGLVGMWTFDGPTIYGTQVYDQSGHYATGTMTGGPTKTIGISGQALSFDGVNDQVEVLDNASLDFGANDFSVAMWVYKRANSVSWSNTWGVNKWNTGGSPGTNEWTLSLTGTGGENMFRFAIEDGSTAYGVSDTNTFSLNTWYHAVGVKSGTYLYVYVNGVQKNSNNIGSHSVNNIAGRNLIIANSSSGAFNSNAIFDEARIYNRALSADEIKKLYNLGSAKINASQNTKITDGLVGLWSFDGPDIYGSTALDRSGSSPANNGTIYGATKAIGKSGQALSFDGADDYVIASSDFIGTNAATFCAWNYSKINTNDTTIVSNGKFMFLYSTLNRFLITSDNLVWPVSADYALVLNTWQHVCATRDVSGVANIYVNGALSGSANQNSGTPTSGTSNVRLGSAINGTSFFNGSLDEVRVYNRALSADEVKRLYNLGR